MRFPDWLPVYGDPCFRGDCPSEEIDQINFVSWLKEFHPAHHLVLIHPKNEGKRTYFKASLERKTGGLPTGASDLVIPGSPCFIVELKRLDHTKCKWQPGQIDYLKTCHELQCFVGVALGFEGAKKAFNEWLSNNQPGP